MDTLTEVSTMTDQEPKQPAREFWIRDDVPGSLCWSAEITVCGPDIWIKDPVNWGDFIERSKDTHLPSIHVIEKSAYDAVVAELAAMEDDRARWAAIAVVAQTENAKLREALEKIGEVTKEDCENDPSWHLGFCVGVAHKALSEGGGVRDEPK